MVGYLGRLLPLITRAVLGRDGRIVSRLRRRVALRQIDPNLHMNQAAYAEVAEWGRADWVIRSGAWSRWRAAGVKPVVAEQRIVYRRELKPRAAYELDTRAVAIEGRLVAFESHFLVGDRVHARCEARVLFVGERGVLAAADVPALVEGLLASRLPIEDWRVVAEPPEVARSAS